MKKCDKCGMVYSGNYAFCPSCGGTLKEFDFYEIDETEESPDSLETHEGIESEAPEMIEPESLETVESKDSENKGTEDPETTVSVDPEVNESENLEMMGAETAGNHEGEDSSNASANSDQLRKLRAALVKEKADHYIPIFEELDNTGGTNWNWCGFFFAPFWMAYRKMYGWAVIALLAPFVIGFVVGLLLHGLHADSSGMINAASRTIGLACAVVFGILSNGLYKSRIDKLAAILLPRLANSDRNSNNPAEPLRPESARAANYADNHVSSHATSGHTEAPSFDEETQSYIDSKGGVSIVGMLAFIIVSIAINVGLVFM